MVNLQNSEEEAVAMSTAEPTKCSFKCSSELRNLIGEGEVFLLSCPVIRYNKYGWRNTRLLVLTQETLIIIKQKNSKAKEVRLRLAYLNLKGLTISLNAGSEELVIHVEMHADIRLACSDSRKVIVDTIKMFYATVTR